jgi:hypothetical protein
MAGMSMAPGPPANPPRRNGVVDRGVELLAAVQTWKRAFILLLLGFAGLAGLMIYQHPEWIEIVGGRVGAKAEPALVGIEQIQRELPELRQSLHAEIAAVFGTEVEKNEQWLMAYDVDPKLALLFEEHMHARWRYAHPLVSAESPWNPILVELLNGNHGCYPLADTYVQKIIPLTLVCAVGIPPGPGALVGWIALGFTTMPDRPEAMRIRTVLRNQADHWLQQ